MGDKLPLFPSPDYVPSQRLIDALSAVFYANAGLLELPANRGMVGLLPPADSDNGPKQ